MRKTGLAIIISGSLGILLYGYLHFNETGRFPLLKRIEGFGLSFIIGAVTGITLYYFNHLLDRWLPMRNLFAARFLVGYIANFVLALVIITALVLPLTKVIDTSFFWQGFSLDDEDLAWKVVILLLTSLFIYNVVYALLYSYQQYAVAQIETLQRERKQLELQFEALKSQISPHYLFNSLNTISSLVYKDPQSAEQFIRRLVQTYQYILSTQHKQFVMLKEEVEFVQSYYYLLRIRFQQQLSVEVNLPSGIMNTKIPPLTLQILVENAVKHNQPGSDKKLFIYITAQDNTHLRVINTKTGTLGSIQSFHMGLENIRKRYEFFTDRKIEIKDDDKFIVSLPVIHHKQERLEHKYSA
jgi:sensor histidine kinase YesM